MSTGDKQDFLPILAATELKVHPALEIIAEIDDEAYAAFVIDVRQHGFREAIVLDADDLIVDGRLRRRTALEVGLELPYVRIASDVDVRGYIESRNVHRRHLSAVARAFIAAADLVPEHAAAKDRQGHARGGISLTARKAAGDRRNVSAGYVGYAAAVEGCGDLNLRAQVLSNEIPLSMGARIAAKDPEQRKSLMTATRDKGIRLTPISIPIAVLEVNGLERFDLDPATTPGNPIGAREFYALENGDDGLTGSWQIDRNGDVIRFVWVNPPYDDPASWVRRAIETIEADPSIAVWMLLPSRVIGTSAGRNADDMCTEMLHFNTRLKFVTAGGVEMPGSLNDGSVLYAFGAASCNGLKEHGTTYLPRRPEPVDQAHS